MFCIIYNPKNIGYIILWWLDEYPFEAMNIRDLIYGQSAASQADNESEIEESEDLYGKRMYGREFLLWNIYDFLYAVPLLTSLDMPRNLI